MSEQSLKQNFTTIIAKKTIKWTEKGFLNKNYDN